MKDETKVKMVVAGFLITFAIIIAVADWPRDPLDLNRDGRVTVTDMLIAKRMELQIKARILGLPEPFPTVEVE